MNRSTAVILLLLFSRNPGQASESPAKAIDTTAATQQPSTGFSIEASSVDKKIAAMYADARKNLDAAVRNGKGRSEGFGKLGALRKRNITWLRTHPRIKDARVEATLRGIVKQLAQELRSSSDSIRRRALINALAPMILADELDVLLELICDADRDVSPTAGFAVSGEPFNPSEDGDRLARVDKIKTWVMGQENARCPALNPLGILSGIRASFREEWKGSEGMQDVIDYPIRALEEIAKKHPHPKVRTEAAAHIEHIRNPTRGKGPDYNWH